MKKDGQNELDETLAGGDKHYSRLLEELHLREREQWLILKSLPVIFYRVDPDGNLPTTWISEQIKTITGFSPRDFTENSTFWESRLHPDDHERVIKVYSETLTSGDTVLEYRWQCSDGSYHWFMDHLVVVKNPECDQADTIGICLDVTKSKLAEIALLESEKKYRLLTEYSVDVIWLLNTEGIVTFASPSVEKLCGFTPGEMLTRNMGDLMTPESSQRALETMIDAIRKFRDGEPYQVPGPVELEQICKDGSTVWTESVFQPVLDGNGKLTGFAGVTRNISERRRAEEALRSAELRSRALIEHAPDGIVLINKEGQFIYSSPPALRMFGYTGDELGKHSPGELTHPEELPMVLQTMEQLIQDPKLLPTLMYRFRHKNGSWYWIESTFSNLLHIRGIEAIVINFRNVNDRRLAEEKLRQSEYHALKLSQGIEQSPAAVIMTDTEGKIEYVNPKFTDMTGYPPEHVAGKIARILKRGRTPDDLHEIIWQTIRAGKVWKGEYQSRKMNGEFYWESVSVAPILNPEGIISDYIITIEDITERKTMIGELIQARQKAEESDRLKSSFLANVSHEIRTPMNAIVGFAEMLSDPELTPGERNKFTGIIQSRSDDLMHIINDLLEISRIESGNVHVVKTRISINEILADLEAVFRQRLQRSRNPGIFLLAEKALPDDRSQITTDSYILKQVFSNLIENAIKYTHSGSVRFGYLAPQDGLITFFVKDTGIGISTENQAVIFEHFRRADIADQHQYSGTGLGLAICKGALAHINGKIRVESLPGKGSTFYFTLPFEPQLSKAETESPRPGGTPQPLPTISYTWKEKKLLIVEDESANMELLRLLLKRTQIDITPVMSGGALRELYGNLEPFDLVLLDVRLPDANGWDLTRELKAIRPSLPVIAQTAFAMPADLQKSMAAGCDNYISKPINKVQLLQMMAEYLGK